MVDFIHICWVELKEREASKNWKWKKLVNSGILSHNLKFTSQMRYPLHMSKFDGVPLDFVTPTPICEKAKCPTFFAVAEWCIDFARHRAICIVPH